MQNPIRLGLLALALSTGVAASAPAQNGPTPGSPSAKTLLETGDEGGPLIGIEFDGGTVREYLEAVKSAALRAGGSVNVICPVSAAGVVVPPISLTNVKTMTALLSLNTAAGDENQGFGVMQINRNVNESPTFTIEQYDASTMWRNGVPPRPQAPFSQPNATTTDVFSVREILDIPQGLPDSPSLKLGRDDLLQAVDLALGLHAEGAQPPRILFHEKSGILIVRGQQDQIALVHSVVTSIQTDLQDRRARMAKAVERDRALAADRARAAAALETAELVVQVAQERMRRQNTLVEAGQEPTDTLAVAKQAVEQAELERAHAQAELDRLSATAALGVPVPADGLLLGLSPGAGPGKDPLIGGDDSVTTTYTLKNAKADDETAQIIKSIIGDGGTVGYSEDTGSLVVKAPKARQADVKRLIQRLDR